MPSDDRIKSDVLQLFLVEPAPELTAVEVGQRVIVERPPSRFLLPEKGAKDALEELIRDGYLQKRRSKRTIYYRDPKDTRPLLPAGFRYERRHGSRGLEDWIVTPDFGTSLAHDGEFAYSSTPYHDLLGRGIPGITPSAARIHDAATRLHEIANRLGLSVQRRETPSHVWYNVRAPLTSEAALRALTRLVTGRR